MFKWHSKTGPFGYKTTFDHLNTRRVRYSDPHCTTYKNKSFWQLYLWGWVHFMPNCKQFYNHWQGKQILLEQVVQLNSDSLPNLMLYGLPDFLNTFLPKIMSPHCSTGLSLSHNILIMPKIREILYGERISWKKLV